MYFNRALLSVSLVAVAFVAQVSLLARLRLPGATPDLLLLTVLGFALVYGHVGGSLVGFGAGLLADLAPPSDHAVGRYALVLCIVGYAAGLTRPEGGQHRSAVVPMLVVGAGAVSSTLLYAGVGTLVGDIPLRDVGLGGLVLTAAIYDLLLAPFTVPLVMAMARRTVLEPAVESGAASGGERIFGGPSAKSPSRSGRTSRSGRGNWSSGQRSVLLSRSARSKVGRIKGVKRL